MEPPAELFAPVSRRPSGSCGDVPSGTAQAMLPVLASTAIIRPQGGRKQGRVACRPLASVKRALKPE